MDEHRLKQTLAQVKSTQDKFDELSERGKELDEQLSQIPAIPNLSSRYVIVAALIITLVGVLIGVAILLG
jgi:hypothetical protein